LTCSKAQRPLEEWEGHRFDKAGTGYTRAGGCGIDGLLEFLRCMFIKQIGSENAVRGFLFSLRRSLKEKAF